MRVHPKQSTKDSLGRSQEGRGELDSDTLREDPLVVQDTLCPRHKSFNVRWSAERCGFLVCLPVLPVELKFGTCIHDAALCRCAEFRDGAVEHVDMVEEVNDCC